VLQLLALAMEGCRSADEILALSASAVPWLTGGRVAASLSAGEGSPHGDPAAVGWTWALPATDSAAPPVTNITLSSPKALSAKDRSILETLAERTSEAMAAAQSRDEDRKVKATVLRRLSSLHQSLTIYDRLTEAAASAEAHTGIALTLHEFTGLAVVIEDHTGHVLASVGTTDRNPPAEGPPLAQEPWVRDAVGHGRPVRNRGRMVMPVVAAGEILGAVAFLDPQARIRPIDRVALRHAGAILAVELVHLRTAAQTQPWTGSEILDGLLSGEDEPAAVARARLRGYELDGDLCVVVVEGDGKGSDDERLFAALRRCAEDVAVGSLFTVRCGAAVFLARPTEDWEALRSAVAAEVGGGPCRIGVGGLCSDPVHLYVSHRQAQLALRLQKNTSASDRVTIFEDLGVYRVLSEIERTTAVEEYVRQWLGPLIDYDSRKGAELVPTLSAYLEHGGSHVASAEALSVHRSTLRYRLQRIRALLGHEISDADARFNLQLATRAWTTLDALRETANRPLP